jgi:quercetin 2,3-dioxygenase
MSILKYSQLPPDGFAGVRMREIVKDRRLFGIHGGHPHASGIGRLVYVADANFVPHGDTRMHGHAEIDIITLVLRGRLRHQGSMGDGQVFNAYEAQIQRAGGLGLVHNEVNPDAQQNHVIQIWLLPEQQDAQPEYRVFESKASSVTRVYGGLPAPAGVIDAATTVDIVRLAPDESYSAQGPVNLYVGEGHVRVNDHPAEAGDFMKVESPGCTALTDAVVIVIGDIHAARKPQ